MVRVHVLIAACQPQSMTMSRMAALLSVPRSASQRVSSTRPFRYSVSTARISNRSRGSVLIPTAQQDTWAECHRRIPDPWPLPLPRHWRACSPRRSDGRPPPVGPEWR